MCVATDVKHHVYDYTRLGVEQLWSNKSVCLSEEWGISRGKGRPPNS